MDTAKATLKKFATPVILVGGGAIAWDLLNSVAPHKFPIIAVDTGARYLSEKGITPALIIGDMDSAPAAPASSGAPEVIEIAEQETTDFEKALYALDAPLFLAFGFWGKRLDHSLAALHSLTKYRSSKRVVLVDQVDLLFAPQGPLDLALPLATRVSLLPLKAVVFESSIGLKYPLDGLRLESGSAIGVSNETADDHFRVVPRPADKDNYVVVLPNAALPAVLSFVTRSL
ncbi:MAG: thiamine diphosphokinase [Rhodospirillales bacterium]|nr:thiamine diphosphokinase [Rhodospirillales bacterium]